MDTNGKRNLPSRETKSPEVQEGVSIKAEGAGKDSVSLLQEFCAKRGGLLPKYDDKNWCYESRVRIGDITETGEGKTGKLAMEQAATGMLKQLQDKEEEGATKKSEVEETEGAGTDAISRLQSLCAKKGIFNNPFEYGVNIGVTVGNLTETGVDKSKELAKRQAASNMLRHLQDLSVNKEEKEFEEQCGTESKDKDLPLDKYEDWTVVKYKRFNVKVKKPPMTLYIDGLNYIWKFFPNSHSMESEKEKVVQKAKSKIKKFVEAAKKSAIHIEVFLDKGMSTEETSNKWKSRREKELRTGKYSMVPCVSMLLGELFHLNGVKVNCSIVDNDDTIASFAHHYGGSILSNDSDFFRYISGVPGEELKLKIFSGFEFNKSGGISLIPAQENPKKSTSKRILISPPPETRNDGDFFKRPMQWQILKHPDVYEPSQDMYYRGNVTCLLKSFPNPHLTARPLRQALYKRLGKTYVREVICTWNFSDEKAEWNEENVFPDDTFDSFLDSPQEALKKLFGDLNQKKPIGTKEVMWNHLFAQKVVVATICSWATGRSVLQSI